MTPLFDFDNSYANELRGLYSLVQPPGFADAQLIVFNDSLAQELGLDVARVREAAPAVFSGHRIPEGATPLAQAYAGHQFGHLSPQLGDGRALLLGELLDGDGARWDLQLKGSGRTPYSRGGDGRATLGPVLREYIMGEAMHRLGVPTTRALAAVSTGDSVPREGLLPGAILARVAASHLRVGTFEFFAARRELDELRRLTGYALARHFPARVGGDNPALALLEEVISVQARLISEWMLIGFVHGVMNTDNATISGETIDYGPCAFMDAYGPSTVFSSIDRHGRYRFENQPGIGAWNLARFAEALLPLLAPELDPAVALAQAALDGYAAKHEAHWLRGARQKLGLATEEPGDEELVRDMLSAMHEGELDYTSHFRRLSGALRSEGEVADSLPGEPTFVEWVGRWLARAEHEETSPRERADAMDRVNPIYIARNHKVEEALAAAHEGDLSPFTKLGEVLSDPYVERASLAEYAEPAPASFGEYRTFCGT